MAYSEVEFTYSGGPQVFPTNFALGVLDVDHLKVYVDDQEDGLGNPIEFAFTYDAGTGEVTVLDALTSGWTGRIVRVTPVDNVLVDFETNADVTKRNLARSTKQVLMVVQELTDSREADNLAIQETLDIVEELQSSIDADVQTAVNAAALATTKAEEAVTAAAEALAKENSMLRDRGVWQTGIVYDPSDLFTNDGSAYITQVAHTSTSISADLAANRIRVFASKGASGEGSGDMSNAENLSNLTNPALALSNIGGQPADPDLNAITELSGAGIAVRTGEDTWALRTILSADDSVVITNAGGVAGNINLAVPAPFMLGVGQTWQNVESSRLGNVAYQNTTDRPIMVFIATNQSGGFPQVSVNGTSGWVNVGRFDAGTTFNAQFIVPPGHYYRLNIAKGSVTFWTELR